MSMMAIPSAQGLFQRVWAMSGTQTSGRTVEEAQEDAKTEMATYQEKFGDK